LTITSTDEISIVEEYDEIITETESFINQVLKTKYLKNKETCLDDLYNQRLIPIIKTNELNKNHIDGIENILYNKLFIPAGSILTNIGDYTKNVSLSNCYFVPILEDSLEGIFQAQKEISKTLASRGGVGTDVSVIRPKGCSINNAANFSTGAVSFMPQISDLAVLIGQEGRSGAIIITISINHPDIIDFINCKSNPEKVFAQDPLNPNRYPNISHANISIKITDEFMLAVKNDKDWTFKFPDIYCDEYSTWDGNYDDWFEKGYPVKNYKTIKARKLMMMISESAWQSGDPGILFFDHAKKYSSCSFDKKLEIFSCNPCGEQVLNPWGNCLLGALILPNFVDNPYTPQAQFNIELFLESVNYSVILLDNIIDINRHPLHKQTTIDQYGRRIGVEITGLNDMLAMLNINYNSETALDFVDDLFYHKAIQEIKTSILLSKEKGCSPCLKSKRSRNKFIKQKYIQNILNNMLSGNKNKIINDIVTYGIRNCAFNTIGPTGSLSIIAGNMTSGIEPIFAIEYFRQTRILNGKKFRLIHYPLAKHVGHNILKLSKSQIKEKFHYIESHDISYIDRIKMQSTIQKWIDTSISSTINLPNDATVEHVYDIYMKSYEHNIKGITIFRDGSKTGILSTSNDIEEKTNILSVSKITKHLNEVKSNIDRNCRAYRYIRMWKQIKIYVTVTVSPNGRPIEIFANLPHMQNTAEFLEKQSYWFSTTRLVSLLLRLNAPIPEIIKQLEKSAVSMVELSSIISSILKNFINIDDSPKVNNNKNQVENSICPECGKPELIHSGGCDVCLVCGYSTCG